MRTLRLSIVLVLALGLTLATLLMIDGVRAGHPVRHRAAPAAPGDVLLEFVSYFGGRNDGLAVQGDYIYTGFGRAFSVIDGSDPSHPARVAYIFFPGAGEITDIEIAGSYAYATVGSHGLAVVDISDPLNPVEVGVCEFPLPDGWPLAVEISGTMAYVGQGDKLRAIDIVSPTRPVEVGSATISGMNAADVAITGRYAYVAGRDGGLRVVDVLTPTAPSEVGFCTTDIGYATGVDVAGDYAYVSDAAIGDAYSTAMLRVVDIAAPASPTVVGSEEVLLGANADAYGVQVVGDHAYVAGFAPIGAGRYGGLEVIDISDPTQPDRVTNYVTPDVSSGYDIVVAGGYAFLTTSYSGEVLIVDVSDLGGLSEVGSFKVPEDPTDIVAVDDYAYLFDWGLKVVDISAPASPLLVGEFEVSPPISSNGYVHVRGDHAYLANSMADLWVVDVSDPTNPTGVGSCEANGRDIDLRGNYAYLPDGDLTIVDVANPNAPAPVGTFAIPGFAQRIDIAGDHAYVLADGDLRVLDLTNPTAPQQVGSRDLPDLSNDIAVSGDHAYVVAYDDQLRVIDVSDPTAPGAPISRTITGDGRRIAIQGDYAYIATDHTERVSHTLTYYGVVSVVDISNPISAHEVTTYRVPYDYGELTHAAGDYAYLIGETTGLYTLRIVPLALQVAPASITMMVEEGGPDPAPRTLEVARASRPLTWTATVSPTGATWLSVIPLTGTTPSTIGVDISLAGLTTALSPYEAQVVVESEEPVEGSPQVTDVSVIVVEELSQLYLPTVIRDA